MKTILLTVDANGANEKRITNSSNPDFEPTISRLAKKIAFVSNRHGRAAGVLGGVPPLPQQKIRHGRFGGRQSCGPEQLLLLALRFCSTGTLNGGIAVG